MVHSPSGTVDCGYIQWEAPQNTLILQNSFMVAIVGQLYDIIKQNCARTST